MLTESELASSPAWLPLRIEAGAVTLLKLDERAYQEASFLDERLLNSGYTQASCPVPMIVQAARPLEPKSDYIFHIGHVGSTLVSRLIGAHERFFALREPQPLRVLASQVPMVVGASDTPHEAEMPPLRPMLALWSRTWHPGQRAVLKATSFVSEVAPRILKESPDSKALFIYASPLAYLQGILGGPNSRIEARTMAPSRMRRLCRRVPAVAELRPATEGEIIAMNWLCEMTALQACAQGLHPEAHWVDFDAFLRAPMQALTQVFLALGEVVPERTVESLVSSPLMHRYSKAPEFAYDAALRREVLAAADKEYAQEIGRGMAWLGRVAQRGPLARAALEKP